MLADLIAIHVGHSDLPAEVVSHGPNRGIIRVLGNPMGVIKDDNIVWYPVLKINPYTSKQFSRKTTLLATDPKMFRRLDALIRAAVRAWVNRGDEYAIWWVKNEQTRKQRKTG